tara:strand:- start:358 stop:675 length:318 start_codon:yes stop_codon:yes gene_type:complete
MAFTMKGAPYSTQTLNTPILHVDMDENTLGMATNKGGILVNKDIKDPKKINDVISHEMVHVDQIKRGDLDYDDDNVYWKGDTIPRSSMNEGAKNLPWEAEAYKNA